jgi:hypothetical protein
VKAGTPCSGLLVRTGESFRLVGTLQSAPQEEKERRPISLRRVLLAARSFSARWIEELVELWRSSQELGALSG